MINLELRKLLIEQQVIINGHFVLRSGLHSDRYVNKDRICAIPGLLETITNNISSFVSTWNFDIVTGPAVAGAIFASCVALKLRKALVYPEKSVKPLPPTENSVGGKIDIMEFRRGYPVMMKNRRIIVIEDVITTAGSVKKTIDAIKECGASTVGVVCIWNRSEDQIRTVDEVPIYSLIEDSIKSWTPEDCPMCKISVPIDDPKKFILG